MQQPPGQNLQPPNPPNPTGSGDKLGNGIRDLTNGIINNVLPTVRTELAKQLTLANGRRDALQARLNAATSSSEQRSLRRDIAKANGDIAKLQSGIEELDAKTTASTDPAPHFPTNFPVNEAVPTQMIVSVITIIFIGFPLAIAVARLLWCRASNAPGPTTSQLPADSTKRFDRLEQAVDAIAIEVERISENQRYLTKLLSEPRPVVAVGSGRGEPPPQS